MNDLEYENINIPKLKKDKFVSQVVEYGYFAEVFPACFSAKKLAENLDKVLQFAISPENRYKNTLPTQLSIKKDELSRRIISLPNPISFLKLVNKMNKYWAEIQEYAYSPNSLSPIIYINHYDENNCNNMLNCPMIREYLHVKSDFTSNVKKCIETSLGQRYRLVVDISTCYNSIYTHTISWAICGKKEAKNYLLNKEPKELKEKYELADKLDLFIRQQKNGETNGIVVGPFTSRIFSEIILAAIDSNLTEHGFLFKRYVDDYKFYFQTKAEALDSVSKIDRVLNEYGLSLNSNKTEITCYPFDLISQMKYKYELADKNGGVFNVLNMASELYLNGEKGAYKYALKLLDKCNFYIEDIDANLASFVNILLIEPKCAKYIINYLKKSMLYKDKKEMNEIINKELSNSLENQLQHESLIFLEIIRELSLDLFATNFISILSGSNDFAIIIALDLWKNRKKSIKRKRSAVKVINESIKQLSINLKGETYLGSRWLLLYEIKYHKLMEDDLLSVLAENDVFKRMQDLQITFYHSVNQK